MDVFQFVQIGGNREFFIPDVPKGFLFRSMFYTLASLFRFSRFGANACLSRLEKAPVRYKVGFPNQDVEALFARKIITWTLFWIRILRNGKALCLERSIAIAYNLRLFGIPAQVVIGRKAAMTVTEKYDYHAWVELYDRPISDHVGVRSQFIEVNRVPNS
jgi:Transglutaminase-like superfamily